MFSCCSSADQVASRSPAKIYSPRRLQGKARDAELEAFTQMIIKGTGESVSEFSVSGQRSRSASLQARCGSPASSRSRSPSEQRVSTLLEGMPVQADRSSLANAHDVAEVMGAYQDARTMSFLIAALTTEGVADEVQRPLDRQSTASPVTKVGAIQGSVDPSYRTPPATLLDFRAFGEELPGAVNGLDGNPV